LDFSRGSSPWNYAYIDKVIAQRKISKGRQN
jgi:hypothetical protein